MLHRRPGLRLGLLLGPPMLWLGVLYLGSLAALFITSLWTVDAFGGNIERVWNLDNYRDLFTIDVYRTITIRTLLIAVAVTVIDALLAFPIALYMAKVASPRLAARARHRRADPAVGVVPRQGVRLARDVRHGRSRWTTSGSRRATASSATVVDAVLPVAALHDPADVRRSRAAARTR